MQISQLYPSNAFSNDDVLAIEINGVTYKLTGATLAAALQSIGDYVDMIDLSEEYSNQNTYTLGSYCIYNNVLYRCTSAITQPEDFNSAHWTTVKVMSEVNQRIKFSDVVDGLNNSSSEFPLSAKQGKALNDRFKSFSTLQDLVDHCHSIGKIVIPFTGGGTLFTSLAGTNSQGVGIACAVDSNTIDIMAGVYATSNTYVIRITGTSSPTVSYRSSIAVQNDSISVSYGGQTGTATFIKSGYTKVIRVMISGGAFSSASGVDVIGVVPSGFKPNMDVYLTGMARNSGSWGSATYTPFVLFISSSSGNIQIMGNATALKAATYITMTGTYI